MSKYTVKLDQPNLSPGTLVEVPPVGVLENGASAEFDLTKEQAEAVTGGDAAVSNIMKTKHDTVKNSIRPSLPSG